MANSPALTDLVYLELRDRYDRLERRSGGGGGGGGVAMSPPNPELAEALARVAEARQGPTSMRARVHYAGETYEYLLQRWHDPQWRALVTASRAMERHANAPRRERSQRYARFFSQALLAPSDVA